MEKQIQAHLARLEEIILQFKNGAPILEKELGGWVSFNRAMIADFQHERLAHLWIMLFFGFLLIVAILMAILINQIILYALAAIILIVEIFYIKHYYFLENTIQKMYLSQVELENLLLELEKNNNR